MVWQGREMISCVGGSEPRSMLWEALFDLDHVEARHILAPMVALVGCFFNGGCGCASRKRWQVPQITENGGTLRKIWPDGGAPADVDNAAL